VLVAHDLLGLSFQPHAKFVRQYADLEAILQDAFTRFRDDVVAGHYPDDQESYHWPPGVLEQFEREAAPRRLRDGV